MPRLTEAAAEALSPAQAAALAQVLDLQAEWQNLKEDGRDFSTPRLQGLQRTFEAFRAGLAAYTAQYGYGADPVPERTPTSPDLLGAWCRAVRAVVRRADPGPGGGPAQVAARAYRLADGLAGRLGREPVVRSTEAATRDGVLAVLESVGAWCAEQAARPPADDARTIPSYETPATMAGMSPSSLNALGSGGP